MFRLSPEDFPLSEGCSSVSSRPGWVTSEGSSFVSGRPEGADMPPGDCPDRLAPDALTCLPHAGYLPDGTVLWWCSVPTGTGSGTGLVGNTGRSDAIGEGRRNQSPGPPPFPVGLKGHAMAFSYCSFIPNINSNINNCPKFLLMPLYSPSNCVCCHSNNVLTADTSTRRRHNCSPSPNEGGLCLAAIILCFVTVARPLTAGTGCEARS